MATRPRNRSMSKKYIGFKTVELFKDQIIGVGSYGAVCNALCDDLPCAAKILHPTLFDLATQRQIAHKKEHRLPIKRFEAECEFMSAIRHPNIVQYLGIHQDAATGLPALLMELMDNSLTHFLESSPSTIPYHIQVNICRDITLALSFLHSNGILHRDLSSNNVLLISNVRAKVTDFGMARLCHFNPQASHLTNTMCPGTDVYMPPEAVKETPVYNEKIDCFSFGVIGIQILTRKYPNPTDRQKLLEIENVGIVYVPVSEIERRQSHISGVDSNHPLLLIALACLDDSSEKRPSAQMLCRNIKALQKSHEYTDSAAGATQVCITLNTAVKAENSGNQESQSRLAIDNKSVASSHTPASKSLEDCIMKEQDTQKVPPEHSILSEQRVLHNVTVVAEVHPMESELSLVMNENDDHSGLQKSQKTVTVKMESLQEEESQIIKFEDVSAGDEAIKGQKQGDDLDVCDAKIDRKLRENKHEKRVNKSKKKDKSLEKLYSDCNFAEFDDHSCGITVSTNDIQECHISFEQHKHSKQDGVFEQEIEEVEHNIKELQHDHTSGIEEVSKRKKKKFSLFSSHKESISQKDKCSKKEKKDKDSKIKQTKASKQLDHAPQLKTESQNTPSQYSGHSEKKKWKIFKKKKNREMRVLLFGLDGVGKTTILYKMKLGETVQVTTIPTIGFNTETVSYNGMNFTLWDVGGQDRIRPLWRHYFKNTQALIWVVDCADRDRIDEARVEFHRILNDDEMGDVIVLVFANKQDLPDAMSPVEIQDKMGLMTLRHHSWHIQPSCAISGDGIHEGLMWLKVQHMFNKFGTS